MIIIKLGWSVFAPKDSAFFDHEYLQDFYQLLKEFDEDVFFIHGAGNIWHSFVKEFGLNQESLAMWRRDVRERLWRPFQQVFHDFRRVEIEDLLTGKIDIKRMRWNHMVGGDISSTCQILSGDEAFSYVMKERGEKAGYMVTDIAWIIDGNGHLIPDLDIRGLDRIQFWKKDWDAQNSMFTKVSSLKSHLEGSGTTVWIMHGSDAANIRSIVTLGTWVGTQIRL